MGREPHVKGKLGRRSIGPADTDAPGLRVTGRIDVQLGRAGTAAAAGMPPARTGDGPSDTHRTPARGPRLAWRVESPRGPRTRRRREASFARPLLLARDGQRFLRVLDRVDRRLDL